MTDESKPKSQDLGPTVAIDCGTIALVAGILKGFASKPEYRGTPAKMFNRIAEDFLEKIGMDGKKGAQRR